MKAKKLFLLGVSFFLGVVTSNAQIIGVRKKPVASAPVESLIDYKNPKDYTISGVTVSGIKFLDPNTLISVSGLNVNDQIKIPGERISTAIRRLMEQGIIEDVSIDIVKVEGSKVYLDINLKERPR
jgi:outer membrane protein insertion porin family